MSRSVLFATDGSDSAREAESFVESFLTPGEDNIIVLNVAEEISSYVVGDLAAAGQDPSLIQKQMIEDAEEVAEGVTNRLEEAGFSVEDRVLSGRPGLQICQLAEELDVDCIILGRRGLGSMGELLLGSVSHYVVHHSEKPVTIVPVVSS